MVQSGDPTEISRCCCTVKVTVYPQGLESHSALTRSRSWCIHKVTLGIPVKITAPQEVSDLTKSQDTQATPAESRGGVQQKPEQFLHGVAVETVQVEVEGRVVDLVVARLLNDAHDVLQEPRVRHRHEPLL